MSDRSVRPIEKIRTGDLVLSRDKNRGFVSERIVANHRTQVKRLVILELSNGSTLRVSSRQPFLLHDGKPVKAQAIAKHLHARGKGRKHGARGQRVDAIRLRTLSGSEVRITSSHIVKGQHWVHWLETAEKRNIITGGIESTTDLRLKTDLPPFLT